MQNLFYIYSIFRPAIHIQNLYWSVKSVNENLGRLLARGARKIKNICSESSKEAIQY